MKVVFPSSIMRPKFILANGKTTRGLEEVLIIEKMELSMKECGRMMKQMDMGD